MKKKQTYGTIDEYIEAFPKPIQKKLAELRALIRQTAPAAQEKISYQMPTFHLNGNLVHFAAHSAHIGFHPTPSAITGFNRDLSKYKTSKGAVQFPLEQSLPRELIRRIVRFRVGQNTAKGKKK